MVNFVPAVDYHLCLALSVLFTQTCLMACPCNATNYIPECLVLGRTGICRAWGQSLGGAPPVAPRLWPRCSRSRRPLPCGRSRWRCSWPSWQLGLHSLSFVIMYMSYILGIWSIQSGTHLYTTGSTLS